MAPTPDWTTSNASGTIPSASPASRSVASPSMRMPSPTLLKVPETTLIGRESSRRVAPPVSAAASPATALLTLSRLEPTALTT
eukprot:scaffold122035_cov30-Tisochrysis_lutea.AAC.4